MFRHDGNREVIALHVRASDLSQCPTKQFPADSTCFSPNSGCDQHCPAQMIREFPYVLAGAERNRQISSTQPNRSACCPGRLRKSRSRRARSAGQASASYSKPAQQPVLAFNKRNLHRRRGRMERINAVPCPKPRTPVQVLMSANQVVPMGKLNRRGVNHNAAVKRCLWISQGRQLVSPGATAASNASA